jgi:hypothetical protein
MEDASNEQMLKMVVSLTDFVVGLLIVCKELLDEMEWNVAHTVYSEHIRRIHGQYHIADDRQRSTDRTTDIVRVDGTYLLI